MQSIVGREISVLLLQGVPSALEIKQSLSNLWVDVVPTLDVHFNSNNIGIQLSKWVWDWNDDGLHSRLLLIFEKKGFSYKLNST
jgi:hypothetical protein